MIACLEFRRRAGAEPFAADADMDAHRRDCAACARYQDELRDMDGVIRRALAIDPPQRRAAAGAATPHSGQRRIYAIAASLLAGIAVGAVMLVGVPRASLAREVIGHVAHERVALDATAALAPAAVEAVLGQDGVRLRPGIGDVTYAMRCVYEGRVVPHLVVRTAEGPVAVLLLRHREVGKPMQLRQEGLEGVVLPAPRGSIAIVGAGVADIDGVAQRVFEAVDWSA